jgi:O-acetylserine/cysteine efflux transporter
MSYDSTSAGIVLALLAAALWGLAPVATKGALAGYSPEMVSVIRLGVAAVILRQLGGGTAPWLPRDRWSWISGVALAVDFILYNYGLCFTSAALSGLVINVEVVTTIAFAVWLLGERLNRRRVLGSIVTLFGVACVNGGDLRIADLTARNQLVGNLLVMLAGTSWSLFAVMQRRAPRQPNLFRLLAPIFTVSALAAMPSLFTPSAWQNPGGGGPTMMLLLLILLCTITVYVVYARCQELIDVSALAVVLASIPIFAVGFAWLILGEPVSARLAAGGVVVLAGVLIIASERPVSGVVESTAVERAP